jgi:hypothetical protein
MWESLLDAASAKALDQGLDTATVLEQVAGSLAQAHDWDTTCTSSFVRASDALLSRLDPDEIREVPSALLGLVNDVLSATYPPSPQVKQYARWLLRSLSDLVRKCEDKDMASVIVAAVKQSVSIWILDEAESMKEEEWSYDVRPGSQLDFAYRAEGFISRWSHCTAISCLFSVSCRRQSRP